MVWFKKPNTKLPESISLVLQDIVKAKRIIITIVIMSIVFGGSGYWIGYSTGNSDGKTIGYGEGLERGNYLGYERGYSAGYDTGKEYVVSHLDQYTHIVKPVSYAEVAQFMKDDQTDKNVYSDDFNCVSFSNTLRNNAIKMGIKCGIVSFDATNPSKDIGHALNCFETTDKGIVYFDPQTDGQRYNIEIGESYTLWSSPYKTSKYQLPTTYKITKVDIIW